MHFCFFRDPLFRVCGPKALYIICSFVSSSFRSLHYVCNMILKISVDMAKLVKQVTEESFAPEVLNLVGRYTAKCATYVYCM